MSTFELIIFDCDGVLVDSERITNTVLCDMLNELGLSVSLQDMFELFVGQSTAQDMALITQLLGHSPPDDFEEKFRQRSEAALRAGVKPVAGVAGLLDALRAPVCVASSGEHEKIRLTLGRTGLLDRFEGRIFSVMDVAKAKPDPDVFLLAARTLGVEPSACAVIEDSPTGVCAGTAAGMRVFGFCADTPQHKLRASGAHDVFSDMRQLPGLLQ